MTTKHLTSTRRPTKLRYVICIQNEGYSVSLEKLKIYRVLPDRQASAHQLLRVVDESNEDYLYPADWFVPIALPQKAQAVFAVAV